MCNIDSFALDATDTTLDDSTRSPSKNGAPSLLIRSIWLGHSWLRGHARPAPVLDHTAVDKSTTPL